MSDFNIQFEEQDQSITLEFEQIGGGAVKSVNGKTGVVVLDADDVGAYTKPAGGIPKTDLASAVQTSLGKADSAYQKPSSGIPASDMANGVIPTVDATLSVTGAAADAKKTGDEISSLKEEISELSSIPTTVRQAMLTLFESAAYAETGLTDEIAVVESWAEEVTSLTLDQTVISISGSGTVQLVATTVPAGKTVTWSSSDDTIASVSASGLVTGVSNGSVTITAVCGDKRATCAATVSGFATLVSISAVYTQSGTVYDTDSLDSLKSDLVVTAHYSDSTTQTVTDYTLSGTLTEGTSTVTVAYGGKTTTFNVTVAAHLYPLENGTHTFTTNSRVLTVSNGCEFLYEAPNATSSTAPAGAYLNLSEVSANDSSATAWSNIGNTDSDTPLFTIPANATVRLEVKNISLENIGSSTSSDNKWTVTLRGHQGTTKLSVVAIPDSLPNETEDTYAESVVTAATDVTCLYGYFRNPYKKFGATVYLYVNGVRWI